MQQLKGQSRAPDVLDMGTSFAIKADQAGLLAPYKVTDVDHHPGQHQGVGLPPGTTTTAATSPSATTRPR